VALPVTPLTVAVTVVDPAATPLARPADPIVATLGVPLAQTPVVDTFAVVPSLYVAVAVNCCVAPTCTLAVAGFTTIEVSVTGGGAGVATVNVAVPVVPAMVAVMLVDPAASAIASPPGLIVATVGVPLAQVAVAVTSAVEPSL
jgi:hypothetical protein